MVSRLLDPFARIGAIKHYFACADSALHIYLPKHSGARPVPAGAYIIPVRKFSGFVGAKQFYQVSNKVVAVITGKAGRK
jgi:hypothetical protein